VFSARFALNSDPIRAPLQFVDQVSGDDEFAYLIFISANGSVSA